MYAKIKPCALTLCCLEMLALEDTEPFLFLYTGPVVIHEALKSLEERNWWIKFVLLLVELFFYLIYLLNFWNDYNNQIMNCAASS